MGTVAGNMIFHALVTNSRNNFVDLFVLRDVLHVKIAVAVIVILTCIFGIKIAFAHGETFSRTFLFNSCIVGILIQPGSLERWF